VIVKRVIIVPILDVHRFRGFEEVYRDQSLAALVGDTTSERSRERYPSLDLFLEAVARGEADRYTFQTVEEAAAFAKKKLETLNRLGKAIEDGLNRTTTQKARSRTSQRSGPKSFETLQIDALLKKG
jgi:hypothetical protein